MHARELIELAAIISASGPALVCGVEQLSAAGIEQYWTTSKSRLDRWGWSLKSFNDEARRADAKRHAPRWPYFRGVFEEILTGEVLTRTWAAVLCAHDRQHGTDVAEPIARSVLIGHLEARHRVLMLLVHGPGIDAEQAVKLNYLRRRSERWTDLLVGYLTGLHEVSEFAIEPQRAKDFAEDLRYRSDLPGGRYAWPLMLASLRSSFRQSLGPMSPNADLNARIASSILSCFPPECFDSIGLFSSLWMVRIANATSDAQGMIENLLALDKPVTAAAECQPTAFRSANRLRRFGRP
jgi:hypothetical protein